MSDDQPSLPQQQQEQQQQQNNDNDDVNVVVRLHILRLHENPVLEGDNYERFSLLWLIDDDNGLAHPIQADDDTCPASSSSSSSSTLWNGISHGDLIYLPELLTGAGEFEGVRVAGERIQGVDDGGSGGGIPLLNCGVEHPEFPQQIANFATNKKRFIRELYERPFDSVLHEQGLAMEEVMGGEQDEFWANPPVQRRRSGPASGGEESRWIIPLRQCVWVRTISFVSRSSTRGE